MKRILVPREKSKKDDDNEEEDLDDQFKGCYPVSFPPGNIIKYDNFNNILCIYGCV